MPLATLLVFCGCIVAAKAAGTFVDYALRDPLAPDVAPPRVAKVSGVLLIGAPFFLVLLGLQSKIGVLFPASVSLACTSLIIPATFGRALDESPLGWRGRIERGVLSAILASGVAIISSMLERAWWYMILVGIGWFGLNSRLIVVSLAVQSDDRSDSENERRVERVRRFHNEASRAYVILGILLGIMVSAAGVGVKTWNTGGAMIRAFVLEVIARIGAA